uniref:Uncharacterized protein n=1 Tax=Arundo donax TaxID=35708 RepID=A0A0A9CJS9_ARUDO
MMGDGDFGSEGNTLFDSCEGKMGNADSQEVNGSNEMMGDGDFGSEDVGYSDFGSEDLGDSDSAIYSGGDPSSCEEMDDDDEEMEDDNFEPFYYYGQAGVPNSSFEEKRPEAKHTNGNLDILDDDYELQVERGIVTRWACVNYSSLAYKRSQRLLFKIRNMCVAIGMEFAVLPLKELGVSAGKDDIQQLLDADKIELLLLIPPFYGCDDGVEENIEKMCKVAEVAYQRCFPYLSQLDLKKLARQIQSKVLPL